MNLRLLVITFLLFPGVLLAGTRQLDDYRWEGVDRIVVVGDIHGDFENYMSSLRAAGLVDDKGKWAGGTAHLVQLGDLPDRGPDTRKIIKHIQKLEKQAQRMGGRVHSLIGNHEVMNVTGDLRYVHPGEFTAFANRKSSRLRDRYFEMYMAQLRQKKPESFAALPENFREDWEEEHPLGWLEHRQAWDPRWHSDADLAEWVMSLPVAIRINDTLFVHGGISAQYCANSLESLTDAAVEKLANYDINNPGILEDPVGPFWYRGLSGVEPRALSQTVAAILQQQGVSRIVVGHTPTRGVIWPEYDGRVIVADTGISSHYGGHAAYLEITSSSLVAGYPWGELALPATDEDRIPYLEKVIRKDPENRHLRERLEQLQRTAPASAGDAGDIVIPETVLICGSS